MGRYTEVVIEKWEYAGAKRNGAKKPESRNRCLNLYRQRLYGSRCHHYELIAATQWTPKETLRQQTQLSIKRQNRMPISCAFFFYYFSYVSGRAAVLYEQKVKQLSGKVLGAEGGGRSRATLPRIVRS